MTFQTNLLSDLRRFDLSVIEIDGWRTRGRESISPKVGVNHHTAGPLKGVTPSLFVCINGRPGLDGPLCNAYLGRDGIVRLVAAGKANHAGLGGWKGISGNSNTLGLEAEHVGTSAEPVTADFIDKMARIQAAFAWQRYDADHVCQHWEWAPNRKIDFVKSSIPASYTPEGFREKVRQYLKQGGASVPPTTPNPPNPGDELVTAKDDILAAIEKSKPFAVRAAKDGHGMKRGDVWIIDPLGKYHVDRDTLNGLYFSGSIRQDKNQAPPPADPKNFASIPVTAPRA